jgi:DNA-3-methyladenine glycosylase
MKRLSRAFYARDTLIVAHELLGQRLVRLLDGQRIAGRIVEVEAYIGEEDKACHAAPGRTARNVMMYGPAGHAYVYFIYGMHHCFNVVTEREGFPAAVLVRALEPEEGIEVMRAHRGRRDGVELTNGPAKLCYALGIDRALNGVDLVTSAQLWIEQDVAIEQGQVATGPRVGVRGDERALKVAWRFWLRTSPYISKGGSRSTHQ